MEEKGVYLAIQTPDKLERSLCIKMECTGKPIK